MHFVHIRSDPSRVVGAPAPAYIPARQHGVLPPLHLVAVSSLERLLSLDLVASLSPRAGPLFFAPMPTKCASAVSACVWRIAGVHFAALRTNRRIGIFILSLRRGPYPPPSALPIATPGKRLIFLPRCGPIGRWRILLPRLSATLSILASAQVIRLHSHEWSLFFCL